MTQFTVKLSYSWRTEKSDSFQIEAADKLEAERLIVEQVERGVLASPGANDFDVFDISVVEVSE